MGIVRGLLSPIGNVGKDHEDHFALLVRKEVLVRVCGDTLHGTNAVDNRIECLGVISPETHVIEIANADQGIGDMNGGNDVILVIHVGLLSYAGSGVCSPFDT
jgi:hypothetical protein